MYEYSWSILTHGCILDEFITVGGTSKIRRSLIINDQRE